MNGDVCTICVEPAAHPGRCAVLGLRRHKHASRLQAPITPTRLRAAGGGSGAGTVTPVILSVAEAIHQRFLWAAVDLDHRAVDEMRQIRSKVGNKAGDLLAFGGVRLRGPLFAAAAMPSPQRTSDASSVAARAGNGIADEDSIAFLKDKIFAVNGSLVDLDSQEPW